MAYWTKGAAIEPWKLRSHEVCTWLGFGLGLGLGFGFGL